MTNNVIQGNFKQVRRNYGHKKITEDGVNALQSLYNWLSVANTVSPDDRQMIVNMLSNLLENAIFDKYQITDGHTVI